MLGAQISRNCMRSALRPFRLGVAWLRVLVPFPLRMYFQSFEQLIVRGAHNSSRQVQHGSRRLLAAMRPRRGFVSAGASAGLVEPADAFWSRYLIMLAAGAGAAAHATTTEAAVAAVRLRQRQRGCHAAGHASHRPCSRAAAGLALGVPEHGSSSAHHGHDYHPTVRANRVILMVEMRWLEWLHRRSLTAAAQYVHNVSGSYTYRYSCTTRSSSSTGTVTLPRTGTAVQRKKEKCIAHCAA